MHIDLNADVGEGCGDDAALLRWVSSASIACGGHAGGEASMREALRLCRLHGVAAGAHPSYLDPEHFGRRELDWRGLPVAEQMAAQIENLQALAREEGVTLRHVKPHGALYNQAAREPELAALIARTVRRLDPQLALYGLAGSALTAAARQAGLRAVQEAFADRAYQDGLSLLPRSQPGSLLHEPEAAIAQVLRALRQQVLIDHQGRRWPLQADSFCLHGDSQDAAQLAARLHDGLRQAGVRLLSPSVDT
ncbi:MAG: LamB/YcsF family protein [Burkholderiales bacterium]|uniref:5-oxoprolinase subunit PxpA n=1 Tax=Inhella sp. TaxID=1921806 RepID=UPI001ACA28DA|nr:LamB/YcsF family protein [Burkholderiales bacterium]